MKMSHTRRKLLGASRGSVQLVTMAMVMLLLLGDRTVLGMAETPGADADAQSSHTKNIPEEINGNATNGADKDKTLQPASVKLNLTAPSFSTTAGSNDGSTVTPPSVVESAVTTSNGRFDGLGTEPTIAVTGNTNVVEFERTNNPNVSSIPPGNGGAHHVTEQSGHHALSTEPVVKTVGRTIKPSVNDMTVEKPIAANFTNRVEGTATITGPMDTLGLPITSKEPLSPTPPPRLTGSSFPGSSTANGTQSSSYSHSTSAPMNTTGVLVPHSTHADDTPMPHAMHSMTAQPTVHRRSSEPPGGTTTHGSPERTTVNGSEDDHTTGQWQQLATTPSPTPWIQVPSQDPAESGDEEVEKSTAVRITREATTLSDESDVKCVAPTFKKIDGHSSTDFRFSQSLDVPSEYTVFNLSGVGLWGNDTWELIRSFDAEDTSIFIRLAHLLIPGEEYMLWKKWCVNDSCPDDGECPPFGPVRKDFSFNDFSDTVSLVEDSGTTSAVFRWRLGSGREAYLPQISFDLNLTNDGTLQNRTEQTFNTSGTYASIGAFRVGSLAPGARYTMNFNGSKVIDFITAPAVPEELNISQVSHKSANFSWYQPGFADNYTILYQEDGDPAPTSLVAYDNMITLGELRLNATYNVSVYAQTENRLSDPASFVFSLNPPKLGIDVLQQSTTWVEVMVYIPEVLREFTIIVYGTEKASLPFMERSMAFNITELTPGENHRIKFTFFTGKFYWLKEEKVATRPLPPSHLSVDNSIYRRLEICWIEPFDGGSDHYLLTIDQLQPPIKVWSPCYPHSVNGGVYFNISMKTVSNDLESESAHIAVISAPAQPRVEETNKTATNVALRVYCPTEGSVDRVHYTLCPFGSNESLLRDEISCLDRDFTSVSSGDVLAPGDRYEFKAKSTRSANDDLRADSSIVMYSFTTYPLPPTLVRAEEITGLEITLTWLSDCHHCNFTIYAVPHQSSYLGEIVKNSSCENRLHDKCKSSLAVTPEELYDITVTSWAWDEESLSGSTVYNISMPHAIKHVKDVVLESLTPTVVSLSFSPPEVPRERITHYVIKYQGSRDNGEPCTKADKWLLSSFRLPMNFTVKGGCIYNFTIRAYFGDISGEAVTSSVVTQTGALKPKDQPPSHPGRSTHHSFEVTFDPSIFDDEYGPVQNFTVIVAEAISDRTEPLALAYSLPGWAESIGRNPIPPYQAFPLSPVYDLSGGSGGISKRSVTIERTFSIGSEDCGSDSPRYCNGPLIGGKTYVYWFRGFNDAGFTDTELSPEFQLPKNQSSLIIGCLIVLMILFLIVIFLAVLLLKKRLHLDNKGAYQPTQTTEGVNLKTLTRKASTRAKYIRAVKLTEFCQDYDTMSAHSNYGYSQEFETLCRVGRKLTCYDSVLPENVSKNRYTNILPYDKTRVKLDSIDDEHGSDYINANYIPGFSSPREYIACQGPLPGTVDDMWRMIWEKNVSMIVMVTQLVEKGKVKCEQYWPEDHRPVFYGDIQVTMTTMNETESWNFRDFNLYKASVDQRKRVKHFNYLSWPDHGVPDDGLSLLNFIETVREAGANDGSPIVVHCSAGCGRTGTLICLDQLLQQMDQYDYVNVLGTAAEMRSHRQHMIQTEQQYVFIHRCLLDILDDNPMAPTTTSIQMNGNTGGALLMEMV